MDVNQQFLRAKIVGRAKFVQMKRRFRKTINSRRCRQAIRRGEGLCFVYCSSGAGLGALYLHVLLIHRLMESNGIVARVSIPQSVYGVKGVDVMNAFWRCRHENVAWSRPIVFYDLAEVPCGTSPHSLVSANVSWTLNYELYPHVEKEVSSELANLHLTAGEYAAIHYRSSDKVSEAVPPDREDALGQIHHWAQMGTRTYVATDDPVFAEAALERFGDFVRIPQHSRAVGLLGVHHRKDLEGKRSAEEALTTMICLSRAKHLVKSPSALSGFSLVIRPDLPCTPIGSLRDETRLWFPDSIVFHPTTT